MILTDARSDRETMQTARSTQCVEDSGITVREILKKRGYNIHSCRSLYFTSNGFERAITGPHTLSHAVLKCSDCGDHLWRDNKASKYFAHKTKGLRVADAYET